jgi:ketosteroid isomerase-like protein
MKTAWFFVIAVTMLGVLMTHGATGAGAQARNKADDMAAIERLHQQDIAATLSGKADDLTKLWTDDAVRLGRGGPAEVGKAAIYASDKRQETNNPGAQITVYKPAIQDLQIMDGWAFEWGYFEGSYKESANANAMSIRGKVLRVLKRQPDGSWKFARVMWDTVDPNPAGEQK